MRARDVSRPRAEDLTEAAEGEDALAPPGGSAAAGTVGMTGTAGTARTSRGKVPTGGRAAGGTAESAEERAAGGTAESAGGRAADGTAESAEERAARPADGAVPPIPVAPSRRQRRRNR